MRVNGIIAEYNPFHNGHKYHLETSRKLTGADYTIIVMSGNFVQRGAPALLSKYDRAEMALQNGADLVLELPAFYACGSAEYFALGAVSLLDKLGVVDTLCFGSECGDIDALSKAGLFLADEPEDYRLRLNALLEQGHSFPTARSLALESELAAVCQSPNNILGIEYIKALIRRDSPIRPVTIERQGSGYHHDELEPANTEYSFASAHAIRKALSTGGVPDILANAMPEGALRILTEAYSQQRYVTTGDFSSLLIYKLFREAHEGYSKYLDVSVDLSDKILKSLHQFKDFDSFCELLKSRNLTYSRISRCLMHILLDITSEEMDSYKALDHTPYARILGFRKESAPLLAAIKEHSSIPLISKLADAHRILSHAALGMLNRDVQISHIYNAIGAAKSGSSIQNEYSTPIVICP